MKKTSERDTLAVTNEPVRLDVAEDVSHSKVTTKPSEEIDITEDVVVDLSTSCTKDVAVAKLLGWMRGPIRRRLVRVSAEGITLDQLPYLHTLELPLASVLSDIRAAAQQRLFDAFEAEEEDSVMQVLEHAVQRCDRLIRKALSYMLAIQDELSKGHDSLLRIDQFLTAKHSEQYITLSSLHEWANLKFGVAILEEDISGAAIYQPADSTKADSQESVDESAFPQTRKFRTVYATVGFLMASYASKSSKCQTDGRVNVSQITDAVSDDMDKVFGSEIKNHSKENMRQIFRSAMRECDEVMKKNKVIPDDYLKCLKKVKPQF